MLIALQLIFIHFEIKIKASFQISAFVLIKISHYMEIYNVFFYILPFVNILTNQVIGGTPTLIMPKGSYQRVSKHP